MGLMRCYVDPASPTASFSFYSADCKASLPLKQNSDREVRPISSRCILTTSMFTSWSSAINIQFKALGSLLSDGGIALKVWRLFFNSSQEFSSELESAIASL